MIRKYKFKNWNKTYPDNFIEYLFSPCGFGLKIINLFFQKILKINGGVKFMVHFTSQVNGRITLGRNVVKSFANSGSCYVQGINGVYIGDNTIFAPGVKIISSNHKIGEITEHVKGKPIKIGSNCWIGANSVILPNVELGDNVVVGAGSIVTKSFSENTVIAGNPAKIIKKL